MTRRKILIVDIDAPEIARDNWEIIRITDGEEVLDALHGASFDLYVVDLFTPKVHGIEILRQIKGISKGTPVILTCYQPMLQNYEAAMAVGADAVLAKPYEQADLVQMIEAAFKNTLEPLPFEEICPSPSKTPPFLPKPIERSASYLRFWGTRGSTTVSGAEFVRFGGNTPCLEISHGSDLVIIDAGAGIRGLGLELLTRPKVTDIHLFLSHTHLDHVSGLPFFAPLHCPSQAIHIYSPIGFYKGTQELLSDMLTHAVFPVDLHEVRAKLFFHPIKTETPIQVGKITVEAYPTYHPGACVGFRIDVDNLTLGYVTDNEVLMGFHGDPNTLTAKEMAPHRGMIEFFRGSSLMIHEAQYTPERYLDRVGWGHSSVPNATALIRELEVPLWVVTHHEPLDTDEDLQRKHQLHLHMLDHCGIQTQIRMAYDGMRMSF